jgi:hypothetical protein
MKNFTLKSTLMFALLACGATAMAQTNLLTNGSFETLADGKPSGWTISGTYTVGTTGAQDGTNCITWGSGTLKIEQIATVELGSKYELSFYYGGYAASSTNGIKNYTVQGTGGTVYIDGTPTKLDAATGWTKYTKEFTATGTQVKVSIRAYEACNIDNVVLVKTGGGEISYTPVATLKELRDLFKTNSSALFQYTGTATVTLMSTANSKTNMFIQDGTAAIDVYDATSAVLKNSYKEGSTITGLKGSFATYAGLLEIVPLVDGTIGTGTPVTPTVKDIKALTDDDQSKLIKVEGAKFTDTGAFAASKSYTITTSDSSIVVRTNYADLTVIGTNIPTETVDVTGILSVYNGTQQIIPTKAPETSGIKNVTDAAKVVSSHIYNISGQQLNKVRRGINVIQSKMSDGSTVTKKEIVK